MDRTKRCEKPSPEGCRTVATIQGAVETDLEKTRAAARRMAKSVLPILETEEGSKRRRQTGTGFILGNRNGAVFVTAHHVVEGPEKKTVVLSQTGKVQAWPATYGLLRPSRPDIPDADVAYITGSIADEHRDIEVHAVPMERVAEDLEITSAMTFIAIGYPGSKARMDHATQTLSNKAFFGITHPVSHDVRLALEQDRGGQLDSQVSFDPRVHIAVKYDRDGMTGVDGRKVVGPLPSGMSGGTLFLVTGRDTPAGRDIVLLLAGVLIEYRSKHDAIIATRIDCVMDAISPGRPLDRRTHVGSQNGE